MAVAVPCRSRPCGDRRRVQRIRLVVDFAADVSCADHDLHTHGRHAGDLINRGLIDNVDDGCVAARA